MVNENHICPMCSGELIHQGQEMASAVNPDYEGDNEAMVTHLHCQQCGRDFHVFDPTSDVRKTLDYWIE